MKNQKNQKSEIKKIKIFIGSIYKMTDKAIVNTILYGVGATWLLKSYSIDSESWETKELQNFRAWALNQVLGYNRK